MKDWNRIGWTKSIILGILFLPNLIKPIEAKLDFSFTMVIMPVLFGAIAIPLIAKVNAAIFGQIIERPAWNDNPLVLKKPLRFFHFGAFFFLTTGLSMIVGTLVKFHQLNQFGLTTILFGFGILLGIRLLVKKIKQLDST